MFILWGVVMTQAVSDRPLVEGGVGRNSLEKKERLELTFKKGSTGWWWAEEYLSGRMCTFVAESGTNDIQEGKRYLVEVEGEEFSGKFKNPMLRVRVISQVSESKKGLVFGDGTTTDRKATRKH